MILQAIHGNRIFIHTHMSRESQVMVFIFCSPSLDLMGLKASERSTAVTFHAIIPKAIWEWNDTSHLHIQFEGPALGEWKHNVGVFKQSRWAKPSIIYSQLMLNCIGIYYKNATCRNV